MNRNLDGTKLTTDDLLAIAQADGQDMGRLAAAIDGHGANWSHSLMLDATRKVRFAMFMDGKLNLDTSAR